MKGLLAALGAVGLLVVVWIVVWSIWFEKGLSDAERIAIAAQSVAYNPARDANFSINGRFVVVKVIPYANGEALMAANSGCCVVGVTPGDSSMPTCRGWPGVKIVSVNYRMDYIDENNAPGSRMVTRYVGVHRDGAVCDWD